MKTAIVILNWNGRELLNRFLPHVIRHSSHLADIYVADNASTDDSVALIKNQFPEVKIIQNAENGGYAKGYNDALKHVQADLYVLLNSDVQTTEGWLQPMMELFKDERVGAAQPKIKDLKNPEYFEYAGAAGGFLDSFGYPFCRGRIFNTCEKDTGQYNDIVEIQWASGACLFIRSDAFWQAEGLDESFFAHQEEIDLCWRLRANEWKILAVGESTVLHLGGATLDAANPKKTFYNFRNTLFALVKNVSGNKVIFLILGRLILDGIAGIKFLLNGKLGHLTAILKAHMSFYAHLPSLVSKRNALQRSTSYNIIFSIVYVYFVRGIEYFSDLKLKP